MPVYRRFARPISLACATAALAVAPGAALARPAIDPPVRQVAATEAAEAQPSTAPVVREVRTEGDTTLALVLSGTALLIAALAAGVGAHDHRNIGRVAH